MKNIFLLLMLLLSACAQNIKQNPRLPAQIHNVNQCPLSAGQKPLFTVLENNSDRIRVNLDNFVEKFEIKEETYDLNVTFIDTSTKDFQYKGIPTIISILNEKDVKEPYQIEIPVTYTGVYNFELSKDGTIFWKQKVFAKNKSENTLSLEEKTRLAQKYAPVLQMHKEERYYPTSLEYIFNQIDTDPELANEPFYITNKNIVSKSTGGFFSFFTRQKLKSNFSAEFLFKDVDKVLPYYGHSESVLKSGLDRSSDTNMKYRLKRDYTTVYYSVMENQKWNEIYINYHFFYPYDPKNGMQDKEVAASHILDRESLTVVLRGSTKQPLYAFYGAHLASQTMAQLDNDKKVIQSWNTGRVFVNWPETKQVNGRLHAVAALGSHGVYPKSGLYAVMVGKIPVLLEEAGGGPDLYPNFDEKASPNYQYELKHLALENVTSDCKSAPYNLLAYSGSTVDVLGPTNATFPPFTDREADFKNYVDPNAPLFDMTKERASEN